MNGCAVTYRGNAIQRVSSDRSRSHDWESEAQSRIGDKLADQAHLQEVLDDGLE